MCTLSDRYKPPTISGEVINWRDAYPLFKGGNARQEGMSLVLGLNLGAGKSLFQKKSLLKYAWMIVLLCTMSFKQMKVIYFINFIVCMHGRCPKLQ